MSDEQARDAEPAHDILAAEAFAMPDVDPELHHGPVSLPEDPVDPAPHDILAAEQFAFPATHPHPQAPATGNRRGPSPALIAGGALLALLAVRRLRRR